MSTLLNRDQILQVKDLKTQQVEVPEWGGAVIVRCLTGAARDSFEASLVDGKGKSRAEGLVNLRARLVALSVVDEEGNPLFTEADIAALGKKSAAALDRIFEAAQRLNRLAQTDVETLAKNSEPDRSGGSTSV
jgi:hypothetical protein